MAQSYFECRVCGKDCSITGSWEGIDSEIKKFGYTCWVCQDKRKLSFSSNVIPFPTKRSRRKDNATE